jgi:hypothetical protein
MLQPCLRIAVIRVQVVHQDHHRPPQAQQAQKMSPAPRWSSSAASAQHRHRSTMPCRPSACIMQRIHPGLERGGRRRASRFIACSVSGLRSCGAHAAAPIRRSNARAAALDRKTSTGVSGQYPRNAWSAFAQGRACRFRSIRPAPAPRKPRRRPHAAASSPRELGRHAPWTSSPRLATDAEIQRFRPPAETPAAQAPPDRRPPRPGDPEGASCRNLRAWSRQQQQRLPARTATPLALVDRRVVNWPRMSAFIPGTERFSSTRRGPAQTSSAKGFGSTSSPAEAGNAAAS